jgi:MbtH protein
MTNPFDNEAANFLVLVNNENQHSLWPAGLDVPGGWNVALSENARPACVEYIERNWTDMRPRSLAVFMNTAEGNNAAMNNMGMNNNNNNSNNNVNNNVNSNANNNMANA